ncbi:hypothetical protein B484DRAFT_389749 [Ochromonadaceae sp. CCMP2298]|nr:hypothetical protein B484DRAFT_389749 [Ochromonadaceae sp. CCMP2298]
MAVAKKPSDAERAAPKTARGKLTCEEKAARIKEQNKIRSRNRRANDQDYCDREKKRRKAAHVTEALEIAAEKERLAAELLAAETELDRKKRVRNEEKARAKRAERFVMSW